MGDARLLNRLPLGDFKKKSFPGPQWDLPKALANSFASSSKHPTPATWMRLLTASYPSRPNNAFGWFSPLTRCSTQAASEALTAVGEVRHLAVESGSASARPLFGRKATAVVNVSGKKIPGTLAFAMGGLEYSVKVALHPEQSPPAPGARAAGAQAPAPRNADTSPVTVTSTPA